MTTMTWTAEAITGLFATEYKAADEATREATKGPHNPYGDAFESLVWHGTIQEAWEGEHWDALATQVNEAFSLDPDRPWEENRLWVESVVKDIAAVVIGTGRPILVAFCDGQNPIVFCEHADRSEVAAAVAGFYPTEDPE